MCSPSNARLTHSLSTGTRRSQIAVASERWSPLAATEADPPAQAQHIHHLIDSSEGSLRTAPSPRAGISKARLGVGCSPCRCVSLPPVTRTSSISYSIFCSVPSKHDLTRCVLSFTRKLQVCVPKKKTCDSSCVRNGAPPASPHLPAFASIVETYIARCGLREESRPRSASSFTSSCLPSRYSCVLYSVCVATLSSARNTAPSPLCTVRRERESE